VGESAAVQAPLLPDRQPVWSRWWPHLRPDRGAGAYAAALGLAAVALALRAGLDAVAPGIAYYIVLLPAIVLAGVFCGTGPAVLAAALSWMGVAALFLGPALLRWPPFNAQQLDAVLWLPATATVLWATHSLRRSMAAAANAQALLSEVFRQLPGAAAILQAPDGALLQRSDQSSQILGHPQQPVTRTADLAAYHGEHADGRRYTPGEYPIARALHSGEVVAAEPLRYRHPDGRLVDLEIYAGPVRDRSGRIVAAVGTAFDVTARRQREAALHQALASRELLLREADHRIKNSLQLVVSLLRLQRNRLKDEDAVEALSGAIARVDAVADAHLALQQSSDLRTVELQAMLDGLCRRLSALNPAVQVRVAAGEPLLLEADKAIPLGLILSEVLTNALRHAFAPGEAGGVTVAAARCTEGVLRVSVADGGAGLPAGPVRRGLGSTIVRSLAAQIGGEVRIEGAPGRGTTVVVSLRLSAV
jgi:two-component sensor histidine kinase/PAS domain-containing protein